MKTLIKKVLLVVFLIVFIIGGNANANYKSEINIYDQDMIDSLMKDDNYSFMNNQKNTLDKSKLTKSEVNYKSFDLSLL